MGPGGVIIIILLVVAFFVLCGSVRVVKQANAYVIENLGTYKCTWGVGLHLLIPVFEKVARRVSLKEQVADFEPRKFDTSNRRKPVMALFF